VPTVLIIATGASAAISSRVRRTLSSGFCASSRVTSLIGRPRTPPFRFTASKYSFAPAFIALPVTACGPLNGATWPITIGSAASTANGKASVAASRPVTASACRRKRCTAEVGLVYIRWSGMARTAPYGQHLRKMHRDIPTHFAIQLQADVNCCAKIFLAFLAPRDIRPKLSKSRQEMGANRCGTAYSHRFGEQLAADQHPADL